MKVFLKLVAPLVAAVTIAACNAAGTTPSVSRAIPQWQANHEARPACPQVIGKPTCFALIKTGVTPLCDPSEGQKAYGCGWTAIDLEKRYKLTNLLGKGSGTIVAVIEVGDEPDAADSLKIYRNEFNLGTATIYRYNQKGEQYNYPSTCEAFGWCVETDLDIEMVSASCPKCTIALMEASSSYTDDLEATEAEAVKLGATIISNSWGCYGQWDCGDSYFAKYFAKPGIAYLASSGDYGYDQIGGPAALANVIAVGGTQISYPIVGKGHYSEKVWPDGGAGCANTANVGSPGVPKPAWQQDPDCSYRTIADVSAQAGLNPGVAVYASSYAGYGGWTEVGGTSVASPLTAGVIALAGNASNLNAGQRFWTLSKKELKYLNAITSGKDGSCSGEYLCTAGTDQFGTYSGPGGWGTPKGDQAY